MPSSEFSSDYLGVNLNVESTHETICRFISYVNEFPEGSARRLEMEAEFLSALSEYVKTLARVVREEGKVTLYDE